MRPITCKNSTTVLKCAAAPLRHDTHKHGYTNTRVITVDVTLPYIWRDVEIYIHDAYLTSKYIVTFNTIINKSVHHIQQWWHAAISTYTVQLSCQVGDNTISYATCQGQLSDKAGRPLAGNILKPWYSTLPRNMISDMVAACVLARYIQHSYNYSCKCNHLTSICNQSSHEP